MTPPNNYIPFILFLYLFFRGAGIIGYSCEYCDGCPVGGEGPHSFLPSVGLLRVAFVCRPSPSPDLGPASDASPVYPCQFPTWRIFPVPPRRLA